jgi:hypothetical protein
MKKRIISISVGKFFCDLVPIDLLVVIYKFYGKVSIITPPNLSLASLRLVEEGRVKSRVTTIVTEFAMNKVGPGEGERSLLSFP